MSPNLILSLVLLIFSIPVGFLLAHLARDELIQGRKWFKRVIVLALVTGIVLVFMQEYPGVLTCVFILIAAYISYKKSFDTNWTRKRIN